MGMRVCAEPGCPTLVKRGTRDGRCATHRRMRDKTRGSRAERGYGPRHVKLRAAWQRKLDAGEVMWCWRCAEQGRHTRIDPNNWQLGHDDHDRRLYRGPECPPCNLATATRRISPDA